jgi:hypothetical protein
VNVELCRALRDTGESWRCRRGCDGDRDYVRGRTIRIDVIAVWLTVILGMLMLVWIAHSPLNPFER